MIPFNVDRNWYERYWLTEPGTPRPPPLIRLIAWALRHVRIFGAKVVAWIKRHRQRARDQDILLGFSDRELWDLGLSRSDIPGVVMGTYHPDGYLRPALRGRTIFHVIPRPEQDDVRLDTSPASTASR